MQCSSGNTDTIAAFATSLGGPIAIIRVSGPGAATSAAAVWRGRTPLTAPPLRTMKLGRVGTVDSALDDHVLAVYMPGPQSYTGEDVVELHCHGSALGARLILIELLRQDCRHAEPGEFTRRAFLNGKLDLTQAEAVADLIAAHSEAALHLANRQLDGMLGTRVNRVYDECADALAEIESRLDFASEDLEWTSADTLGRQFREWVAELCTLLASRREGEILRDGVRLVIAGGPNVGKSSLLNAILGRDRAIVTDIPGTTRDTLEELAHIRGIPIRVIDTAGIRESDDIVEQSGVERSVRSMRSAQVILWVFDASLPYRQQAWSGGDLPGTVILVGNKRDRMEGRADGLSGDLPASILTCALTGAGMDELFDAVETAVWGAPHGMESDVAVSARHAALLERAIPQISDAERCCESGDWELASVALRTALNHLGAITGRTADPDILDTIFSRFCIGK